MSDESIAQPEDNISRAGLESIQEQLRVIRAERERQNAEKEQIVARANAYAKERDDLKAELASVLESRDQMIGDIVADHEKKIADLISERDRLAQEKASATSLVQNMTRLADDAKRRADEAGEEIARLRAVIANSPKEDPFALLWALASEKTKTAVAWVRGKIPADSPILPWFDKTVETVTVLGCAAVKLTREFIAWATPRVIALSKQGAAKLEEMLAKK
jgi:chromosome segregation ATPase